MSAAGTSVDSRRIKRHYYYRLTLFPKLMPTRSIKIWLDRLGLMALFDRNATITSLLIDITLAVIVAVLAMLLLLRGLFADLSLFIFCIVVCGAQYALTKSVQPDAASPIHGFNWLVAYSRPVYFCLLASMILIVDADWWDHREAIDNVAWFWNPYRFANASLAARMLAIRDVLVALILLMPIAFTVGLLPQVNTFAMHILEQIDMHMFGGTACLSLVSALFNITKSLVGVGMLLGVGQIAASVDDRAGRGEWTLLFTSTISFRRIAIGRMCTRLLDWIHSIALWQ